MHVHGELWGHVLFSVGRDLSRSFDQIATIGKVTKCSFNLAKLTLLPFEAIHSGNTVSIQPVDILSNIFERDGHTFMKLVSILSSSLYMDKMAQKQILQKVGLSV